MCKGNYDEELAQSRIERALVRYEMGARNRLYPTVKEEDKYRALKRKYGIKDEIKALLDLQ